jgi:hypothetical protein
MTYDKHNINNLKFKHATNNTFMYTGNIIGDRYNVSWLESNVLRSTFYDIEDAVDYFNDGIWLFLEFQTDDYQIFN